MQTVLTPYPAPGAIISVTATSDTNVRDAQLTLREAMLIADGSLSLAALTPSELAAVSGAPAVPGVDEIRFAIAPGGPQSIAIASPLPTIVDALRIDGTSQPGYSGSPIVVLNGAGVGAAGADGLDIGVSGCTIRALVVNGFPGDGIEVDANDTSISGCYVGTDVTGTVAAPNGAVGVNLNGAASCVVEGSLISGNTGNGIEIVGSSATYNQIVGNRIGTDAAASAALGSANGLLITNGSSNTVGGTTPGSGNVISGNRTDGIVIFERRVQPRLRQLRRNEFRWYECCTKRRLRGFDPDLPESRRVRQRDLG